MPASLMAPAQAEFLKNNDTLKMSLLDKTDDCFAIGFPKESPYYETFNNTLKEMMDDGGVKQDHRGAFKRAVHPGLILMKGNHMKLDFSSVWQYWPFLYHGAVTTLKITAMAAVLGFILGVLLSLIKISKCKPLVWFW